MRSLPSVQSATQLACDIGLTLTDPSCALIGTFSFGDVAALSPLQFEVPFGGGLPSPTTYQVTLSCSPGWWVGMRSRLAGAEARLTVYANSDQFQPHAGRIGSIATDPVDPNRFTLSVYDKLMYNDPLVPVEAIVDSWSTPHIEHLSDGYPLYYGLHTRPFYMTAVASDVSILLGPRNVSSANHVNSVWFQPILNNGSNINSISTTILAKSIWQQQSGGSNVASDTTGQFRIYDHQSTRSRLFGFNGNLNDGSFANFAVASMGRITTLTPGSIIGTMEVLSGGTGSGLMVAGLNAVIPLSNLKSIDHIEVAAVVDSTVGQTMRFGILFGSQIRLDNAGTVNSGTLIQSSTLANFTPSDLLESAIFAYLNGNVQQTVPATVSISLSITGVLASVAYSRYSVFAPQVSSADLAITSNPIGILDDLLTNYTLTPYRQDQSSAAQVLVQSFQFNGAYIGPERQRLSVLMDDFARTCGFNYWASDSGMVGYRVYAESAVATNSIAATITTSDMLSFQLLTSPLGTTIFNQQGYSVFQLDYNFDYQLNKYQNTALANKAVNALCNSAYAGGAQKTLKRQSKYVVDVDAASYANGHAVRMGAQGQDYVQLALPARYFGLEVADILNVKHPLLGSGALFQVTKCYPDYSAGVVTIMAGQLLSANGN